MKKPETKFKEKVLDKLRELKRSGWPLWYFKTQEIGRHGIPDIIICIHGIFVAWELKVDADIEPLQTHNLEKINEAHGIGRVVSPKNLNQCLTELKELAA